jgi:glycine cleavage system H protein
MREVNMAKKWKSVRIRQELVEEMKKEVGKTRHQNLSEFASEAIRSRLQTLTNERVREYLERDRHSKITQLQAQLFYAPKHVWAELTPQQTVRIGITEHFQKQLKEIANVRTDEAGETVSKDEPFGMVETWWFTYDLYSPLNGKILSVNQKVIDNPFSLNADPYQWVVEVQPESTEADSWMNGLLTLPKYRELTHNQRGEQKSLEVKELDKGKPAVHVRLEREGAKSNWSYVRKMKNREAPHLSSS